MSLSAMRSPLTALFLAGVLAAAGCSAGAEPEATEPSTTVDPTSVSPEPTATSAARDILVPLLTSLSLAEAQARVSESGLRLRVREVMGTACLPNGVVLAQRPATDRMVAVGSRVTVEVNGGALRQCGLELPAAPLELDRVARLFERFARGRSAAPPSDAPVALYLGGFQRKVVTHADWKLTKAWRLCPPGGYAGRTCSFSAVDLIRTHVGPLATTTMAPSHPCAHPRPLSATEAGGRYSVTLTPDESLDCTSYWAVQLIVNDVRQVVAVNLVWAEP